MSKNAKILHRFELPILWVDKGNEAKYQLLLLIMLIQDAPIEKVKSQTFKSEEEFNNFLMKIHTSKKELKPINIRYNNVDGISITTLYDQSDIKIFRIDSTGNSGERYYTYRLPGTSLDDILNHTQYSGIPFSHIQLGKEEIEKYLELLEQEGLVGRITSLSTVYLGEIRYEITNSELHDFLHQCWSLHENSIRRMRSTWSHNRGPKDEEETWYRIFYGPKTARNHFEKFRFDRNNLKPQQPRRKMHPRPVIDDIYGYDDEIKRKWKPLKNYSETIEKYSFFSNVIMEWVYPSFLRNLQMRDKI